MTSAEAGPRCLAQSTRLPCTEHSNILSWNNLRAYAALNHVRLSSTIVHARKNGYVPISSNMLKTNYTPLESVEIQALSTWNVCNCNYLSVLYIAFALTQVFLLKEHPPGGLFVTVPKQAASVSCIAAHQHGYDAQFLCIEAMSGLVRLMQREEDDLLLSNPTSRLATFVSHMYPFYHHTRGQGIHLSLHKAVIAAVAIQW